MIDLHSHILPGIDDGAADAAASMRMARTAVADGIRAIAATPHVSHDYDFDLAEIARRAGELNALLAREGLPLAVLTGGEIAPTRMHSMTDEELDAVRLGGGPYVLVDTPLHPSGILFEQVLFALQSRGLQPLLAHPERSPLFQSDPARLEALVRRGVLCSVNAGSMAGAFGRRAERFALHLLREGLVHDVASDAHDDDRRPAALQWGFERTERRLQGISEHAGWLTHDAPAAIIAGQPLPLRPVTPLEGRGRFRRTRRKAGAAHRPT